MSSAIDKQIIRHAHITSIANLSAQLSEWKYASKQKTRFIDNIFPFIERWTTWNNVIPKHIKRSPPKSNDTTLLKKRPKQEIKFKPDSETTELLSAWGWELNSYMWCSYRYNPMQIIQMFRLSIQLDADYPDVSAISKHFTVTPLAWVIIFYSTTVPLT